MRAALGLFHEEAQQYEASLGELKRACAAAVKAARIAQDEFAEDEAKGTGDADADADGDATKETPIAGAHLGVRVNVALGWASAGAADNPHGWQAVLVSVSSGVYVLRSSRRLRADAELDSPIVGRIAAGARVSVMERRVLGNIARLKLGTVGPARRSASHHAYRALGGSAGGVHLAASLAGGGGRGGVTGGGGGGRDGVGETSVPHLLRLGVAFSGAGLTMDLKHVRRMHAGVAADQADEDDAAETRAAAQALRAQMRDARLKATAAKRAEAEQRAHAKAEIVREWLRQHVE